MFRQTLRRLVDYSSYFPCSKHYENYICNMCKQIYTSKVTWGMDGGTPVLFFTTHHISCSGGRGGWQSELNYIKLV